jgi:glycosyltransferase involved in cell wall biosynthesis
MSSQGQPIRVLHVVTRMNTGGVAVLIGNLMRNYDASAFEFKLAAGVCDVTEEDYLQAVARDIPAVKIPSLQRAISLRKDVAAFFEIVKVIREFKPDVIHTHTSKAGLLGRLAAIVTYPKAKRVHTYHGHLLDGYFSKFKTHLLILCEAVLAKRTHRLIAMGNQVKRDLLHARVGKDEQFSVLFPGLVAVKEIAKEKARADLGLEADAIYCLFIGRLTQIKRPDRLLDVVAELKRRNVAVSFLIVGDGELSENVKSRIANEKLPAKMLGWQKETAAVYSAADILLLCSDNEAVSLALIEGSQYSLPLVSTNVGSVGDVVINGSTGLLTESTVGALADAVEALVADAALRKAMGAAGRARAEQYFSLDRMLKDHSDLYRSL